jgi:diacylglycerol kinase (ATP)
MDIRVIVNPAAGTARDREPLDDVQRLLVEQGHRVEVTETAGQGDAERLARAAASSRADVVVAAGGDGTLNEVLNGVAAAVEGLARCAIGILPAGTGNDFARALGITDAAVAVAALVAGQIRNVDVVSLDDRLFLNASAGGFTAETSANVTSDMKKAVGPLAYLIGGARAFFEHEPVPARIEAEGRQLDAELQLFAVCNGAYIGGGHQLAPDARPDDGLMEVCLVKASSTLDFLTLLPSLSSGQHLDDDDVVYFRTREVTLTFPRRIRINTDGELLEASRCHYVIRPGGVRMVAPANR